MAVWTEELVDALAVLESDAQIVRDRMEAALSEVRPDLIGRFGWVQVPPLHIWALGSDLSLPDHDLAVIHRAYQVAGGTHSGCLACFLADRAPLCAAGDCTGGES